MSERIKPVLSALAAIAVWLTCAGELQAQDSSVATLAARLDALAHGFMTTEQVPGAVAAIVVDDDVILHGFGVADLEADRPAGPDDVRFEIGSITKLFTWTAVMMLVEEGSLDLHADVSGYLGKVDGPGGEPLTLAHLMSHRPGYA